MIFYFGISKGNQRGDRANDHWHVYSNTKNPTICTVIDLAKYLLSKTDILTTNSKLFTGNYQYEIFYKIFLKIINKNLEEFQSLGVEKGTLGAYSVRKGAIRIVSSVCNVSPPMTSICLRACWSMVSIKDQYIHYEKAGDQFVGHSVNGISSLKT